MKNKFKLRENLSVIFNLLMVLLTISGFIYVLSSDLTVSERIGWLQFFTVDSNILCGICALIYLITEIVCFRKGKKIPFGITVLKYVGTSAIGLTFIVVLAYLSWALGPQECFTGPNLFMHLIMPVLALVSFIVFECPSDFKFRNTIFGFIPCFIYGIIYLIFVVFISKENGGWNDIYYFNAGGKWFLTMPAVYIAGYTTSVIVWALGKIKK